MVQVSDGRRQEGLVLFPTQAASFTDRFIPMDTTSRFHTYRLVIRGDMPLQNSGPLPNPLVRGIHQTFEIGIGEHFFGQVMARANYSRTYHEYFSLEEARKV